MLLKVERTSRDFASYASCANHSATMYSVGGIVRQLNTYDKELTLDTLLQKNEVSGSLLINNEIAA